MPSFDRFASSCACALDFGAGFAIVLVSSVLIVKATPDPSPSGKAEMPPKMEAFMVVLLVRPPGVPAVDEARGEQLQKEHRGEAAQSRALQRLFRA